MTSEFSALPELKLMQHIFGSGISADFSLIVISPGLWKTKSNEEFFIILSPPPPPEKKEKNVETYKNCKLVESYFQNVMVPSMEEATKKRTFPRTEGENFRLEMKPTHLWTTTCAPFWRFHTRIVLSVDTEASMVFSSFSVM